MNEIVGLSQLITRLAKLTGADSNTCRRFLREFFACVADSISEGESVQIKGLGTFMLSKEPSEDGNPRVLFKPDDALAEEVNRPFSMFEATVLADDVDEFTLNVDDEIGQRVEEPVTIVPEQHVVPDSEIMSVIQEQPVEDKPEVVSEPTPEVEENTEVESEQEKTVNHPIKEEYVSSTIVPSFPDESDDEEDTEDVDTLPIPQSDRKHKWLWIILIAIVLGIIGGFVFGMLVDVQPDVSSLVDESETTVESAEDLSATAGGVDSLGTLQSEQVATSSTSILAEPVYETVSSTNYLSSMARRHYGSQVFWVYIYEANADKLHNPDKIAPGTRLLIPPKSSLPYGCEGQAAHDQAQQKAYEIQRRFQQ